MPSYNGYTRVLERFFLKHTSPHIAQMASMVLRDPNSDPIVKSIAASALSQAEAPIHIKLAWFICMKVQAKRRKT